MIRMLAGIDGGGTRTRVALARADGSVAGFAEGGSYCFMGLGLDAAADVLEGLWAEAWRAAGEAPRPADALFMGTGSVLSDADARTNCELAIRLRLALPGAVVADNDAWNAHAGLLAGRPGILLISGTGSACVGRNQEGATWRSGGWGYLLNDVGSAHALGHGAMVAATRDADGRGPATRLTALVREALGLDDIREIFRKLHHDGVGRAQVAALAPRVVEMAETGDEVARRLLDANAEGLMEMVTVVAARLRLERSELALTGGLITNARPFRDRFLRRLSDNLPGFTLAREGVAPVFGAVLLAARHLTGAAPAASFLERLRATSRGVTS